MTGYIIMAIGTALGATGFIMAVITAVTAPFAQRKIYKRMKEKY